MVPLAEKAVTLHFLTILVPDLVQSPRTSCFTVEKNVITSLGLKYVRTMKYPKASRHILAAVSIMGISNEYYQVVRFPHQYNRKVLRLI